MKYPGGDATRVFLHMGCDGIKRNYLFFHSSYCSM